MRTITIDGEHLGLADVVAVAREGAAARLDGGARARIEASRRLVERLVAEGRPVYGITTGFGHLAEVAISPADVRGLQLNLLRSHAAGVGPPLDDEVVRAVLVLRANALAKGFSGVRVRLVEALLELLARDVLPVIPAQGSLGASGDLAPLAHLALVLVGEGQARVRGETLPGAEALARAGLEPLELEPKEGLALINGTQAMAAVGGLAVWDAARLARTADLTAALTMEALGAIPAAFDPRIQAVRPHPGQAEVAGRLRALLAGSGAVTEPGAVRVQDAYSLRCVPQVHGASRDALAFCRATYERELNAATDNPLCFAEDGEVLSGGNFHGQPLALAADICTAAVANLANIAERRVERLVNPQLSGLPAFLARRGGLHSGLMLAQYTAAALVAELRVLATPAGVQSMPSSANQEDHTSMGLVAARAARRAAELFATVLAIEAVCACQALDLRFPDGPEARLGRGTRAAYRAVREAVPPLGADRPLAPDFEAARTLIWSGVLEAAAAAAAEPPAAGPADG